MQYLTKHTPKHMQQNFKDSEESQSLWRNEVQNQQGYLDYTLSYLIQLLTFVFRQ